MTRSSSASEAGRGKSTRHALVCERRQPRRKGDRDTRGEFMEQHRVREERGRRHFGKGRSSTHKAHVRRLLQ